MTSPTTPNFQPKSGLRFAAILALVTLAHVMVIVLILAQFGWLNGVGLETDDNTGQSGTVIPVTLETAGEEKKEPGEKVEPEPASEQVQEQPQQQAPRSIETPRPTEPATEPATSTETETSTQAPAIIQQEIPLESEPMTSAASSATSSPSKPATLSPATTPPPTVSPPATTSPTAPALPTQTPSGTSSGTSSSTSNEAALTKVTNDALTITPAQVDPNYLHRPSPAYPALSKRLRETGTVLLRVSLDATGAVLDVAVQTSSEYQRLDQAARQAVSQWRFIPASRGQQPIPSTVLVPIEFKHQ